MLSFKSYTLLAENAASYDFMKLYDMAVNQGWSDKYLTKYKDDLGYGAAAVAGSPIYNTELVSLKYTVERIISKESETIAREYKYWTDGPLKDQNAPHAIALVDIKKAEKLFRPQRNIYPKIVDFLDIISNLKETMDSIKLKVAKGRRPKEIPPGTITKASLMGSIQARKQTAAFLSKVVENIRDKYHDSVDKSFTHAFNSVLSKARADGDNKSFLRSLNMTEQAVLATIFMYTPKVGYVPKPNATESLARLIKDTVTNVFDGFISKGVDKLTAVIERKNKLIDSKLVNTQINGQFLECEMSFAFDDGSSFTLTTDVEVSFSKNGKAFYRYPGRFRYVKLANGTSMKTPSEEKMKTEF